MVKISFLVFGYRKITVSKEKLSSVVSAFISHGLTPTVGADGTIIIRERDTKTACKILSGLSDYEIGEVRGLAGALLRTRNKYGIIIGVFISLIMCVLSENTVWDVRISGNDRLTDTYIIRELGECGLGIGDLWSNIDTSSLETSLLSRLDGISWININRRGSVAYVTVAEKEDGNIYSENEKKGVYANIVAQADCVITEITVKRGSAQVKVGDSVKKGDVLIAGILPESAGGALCYAEGSVVGVMSDCVKVFVDRKYEKVIDKQEKIIEYTVKIFNFPINIFKKCGNSYQGCDIIENIKVFSHPNGSKFPLSIVTTYAEIKEIEEMEYSDDELVAVASNRLNSEVVTRLHGADLEKIRTYGTFVDEGYTMYSELVFSLEVGKTYEFEVD